MGEGSLNLKGLNALDCGSAERTTSGKFWKSAKHYYSLEISPIYMMGKCVGQFLFLFCNQFQSLVKDGKTLQSTTLVLKESCRIYFYISSGAHMSSVIDQCN